MLGKSKSCDHSLGTDGDINKLLLTEKSTIVLMGRNGPPEGFHLCRFLPLHHLVCLVSRRASWKKPRCHIGCVEPVLQSLNIKKGHLSHPIGCYRS